MLMQNTNVANLSDDTVTDLVNIKPGQRIRLIDVEIQGAICWDDFWRWVSSAAREKASLPTNDRVNYWSDRGRLKE